MIFGVVLGIAILVLLVVVHELGHAIVARRNGVVVEEFGIGFPPKAWGRKLKNGVYFTLNWLPLGGFVKLQGEHDAATGKGDYGAATFWQKTKILLAGVLMNWVVAAVLISVLSVVGLPKILPNQFGVASDTREVLKPVQVVAVQDGSPAEKAGLKTGDVILEVDDKSITESEQLAHVTKDKAGQTVQILYSRDSQQKITKAELRSPDESTSGYLGISQGQQATLHSTWSAPIVGVGTTAQFSYETVKGVGVTLWKALSGTVMQLSPDQKARDTGKANIDDAKNSVAGPVGVVGVIFPAAGQAGPTQVIFLTAIISLTLAVMNILPIPALDGGRWFTMTIFRLLKKDLTKDREESIQVVGFLVLIGLIILVTISDVGRLM